MTKYTTPLCNIRQGRKTTTKFILIKKHRSSLQRKVKLNVSHFAFIYVFLKLLKFWPMPTNTLKILSYTLFFG